MTNKQYFALLIGCGRIGYTFEIIIGEARSHAGALHKLGKSFACCDIDYNRARECGKHFNVPWFGSIDEAFEKGTYSVVIIATPTDTHADICCDIVSRGNRPQVIVCEKPIAMSIEEAGAMIDICEENHVKLIVNHSRRWGGAYKFIKDEMDKEIERNVCAVIGKCYGDPITVGVHMWDLLSWYSYGDIEVCHYIDLEKASYKLFEIDILTKQKHYQILRNGESAVIFNMDVNKELIIDGLLGENHDLNKLGGSMRFFDDNLLINLYNEVTSILECAALNIDKHPSCDGYDGLTALMLALAYNEGKVPRY